MMLCVCGFHRWSSKATCRKCAEHAVRFINRLSAYQRNIKVGVLNIMDIKRSNESGAPKITAHRLQVPSTQTRCHGGKASEHTHMYRRETSG